MFLSIPNQRMTPSNTPVVMFKETAAGAPPAVQVWFYPGETYGYEFAYPHAQALRIAKASHQSVLAYNDRSTSSSSEADRMTSMRGADVARIDENDKPVSTDETLKESSAPRTAVATSGSTSSPTVEAPTVATARPAARRHLPRTASPLPLLALLSTLSLATGFAVRMARGQMS
jgi:hypothetical protein